MLIGLSLLYSKQDAVGAIERFEGVLARNPTHYGARYQLARAVEASGRRSEAAAAWRSVLTAAESIGDTPVADTARARLRELSR